MRRWTVASVHPARPGVRTRQLRNCNLLARIALGRTPDARHIACDDETDTPMNTTSATSGWRRLLRPRSRPLRWAERIIIIVVLLVAVIRGSAPWLLQKLINDRLARVPEYSGYVGDIDLAVWRGAYVIDQIAIFKRNGEATEPFFSAAHIDFSLAWRDLFRGKVVSDIHAAKVDVTFVRAAAEPNSQLDTDRRWQDLVEDLFPIEIQHLKTTESRLRFIDQSRTPRVDLAVEDLNLEASGLQNRRESDGKMLPAHVVLSGTTIGGGLVTFTGEMALLEPQPVFDVDLAVRQVDLTALNDFLRAYANVDVSRGTFELFLETGGRDGKFDGYVKPFFENLDFANITDRERSLPSRLWESIVAGLNTLVKNKSRDQLGTRVPFHGTFEGTRVGTFTAVLNAVRHGFVQAFSESIEGGIRPRDIISDSAASTP